MWRLTTEPLRVDGDSLVAEVREFSFLTWVANFGQAVGELLGQRAGGPKCNGKPLHSWVKQVVDPDEDLAAAAVRVCFEPDRDEIVTARVVNNRTFTQRLQMTDGAQEWAWTWAGKRISGLGRSRSARPGEFSIRRQRSWYPRFMKWLSGLDGLPDSVS